MSEDNNCNGNGNGFVISEAAWKHMPPEEQSWIMYLTVKNINTRLKKLERWHKTSSFFGGVIGGVLSAIGIKYTP